MADGRVVIDVILEDGSVAKGVADVDKSLGGIGNSAEKASLSIGKIATALGLVFLAKKGIDMVRDSIQGAFNRIDTMEQFQRVMGVMVDDTDAVAASLSRVEDITEGTSMRMDVMANGIQNFVTRGMEIDKATDTMEAWGNAVAFYGDGSNEQFQNVTDALQNMVAKGKVGQDQLNRLFEAGIPATEIYADAVGKSTQDVEEALSKGEISAKDFVNTVSKAMMEGTDRFPEISTAMKDMGMSWGSVLSNMGAYVELGVTDIILAIDEMLEQNGLPDMRQMLDNFAQAFGAALSGIAEKIPDIVNKIKQVYGVLEPWMPLIKSVSTALGIFIASLATFNSTIAVTKSVLKGLNKMFLANPWVLLAAAIVATAALIYIYWEPISDFFINIWNTIKETGLTIWENLKEGWNNAVENVKDAWDSVASFFVDLWNSITEGATSIWDTVLDVWSAAVDGIKEIWSTVSEFVIGVWDEIVGAVSVAVGFIMQIFSPMISFFTNLWSGVQDSAVSAWDNITNLLTTIWNNIQNIASNAWNIIKNVILGPVLLLINLVTGDMEEFKSNLSAIWENISNAAGEIWESIKEIVVTYIETLVKNALIVWELFKETLFEYWDAIWETASNIWGIIVDFIFECFDSMEETVVSVMDTILEKIAEAWNFIYELWETILSAVMDTTSENFQIILDNIHMIMKDIWIVIENIWNFIKETFSNVLAFIKALVTGDFAIMKDLISEQMTLIRETISNIWAAIKNIFSSVLTILKAVVSQTWNNIKSTTSSVFNSVMSTIKSIWNSIKTFFTQTLVDIWNNVKQKFTDIVNSVKEKMDETKQKIEDGWNKAVEFLKGIDLRQIGKDIIDGLINGIKDKVSAVGDAMKSVTDAVTGKVKSILKISSPSKLFKQFGAWTSEGLAIGIENMKGQAEKASEKLGLGVEEAFEPSLEISGVGALDELKGLSANSILRVNPNNKGMGKSTSTTENKYNNVNFDGLFNGANFHVRDENDIPKLAKELNDYIKKSARGKGVVMF